MGEFEDFEDTDYYDIEYDELIHETEKAYLLEIKNEEIWVPKSISNIYRNKKEIELPEWFADQNGLLE